MKIPLSTKKIILKKFNKNDVDLLFQIDSDPRVMKFITLGIPRTFEDIKNISLPRILNSYKNGQEFGLFAAYVKKTDDFIGWFQFEQDKDIDNAIEIGWRLKRDCWGNGYATEVAIALVEDGLKMNKMIGVKAMSENKASIRVMEKAGLNFAEEFWGDYEPHSENPDVRYELKP